MAKGNLAAVEDEQTEGSTKRRQQAPRPVIIVFRKQPLADGSPDVVDITRDPFHVMDLVEQDSSLSYKKLEGVKIGR